MSGSIASTSQKGPAEYDEVLAALDAWRDDPGDELLNKRVQQLCLEYLLAQKDEHWFCNHHSRSAKQADISAATAKDDGDDNDPAKAALDQIALFCVRLVGYKPTGKVALWREHLEKLLRRCPHCVRGWVDAQARIGDVHLRRRWPEDTVRNWYHSLHGKETQRVTEALQDLIRSASEPANAFPVAYNVLLDRALYANPDILSLLSTLVRTDVGQRMTWEKDCSPSAGLFYLLFHRDDVLAGFARRWCGEAGPITLESWHEKDSSLPTIVNGIFDIVSRRDRLLANSRDVEGEIRLSGLPVSESVSAWWSGISKIAEALPVKILQDHFGGGGDRIDIVRLVTSHLGDSGEHWVQVLVTFRLLLEKLDEGAWKNLLDRKGKSRDLTVDGIASNGEAVDLGYAGARLYDALDNPQFAGCLSAMLDSQAPESQARELESALFDWMFPFIRSLRSSQFFVVCLSAIASRLLEEYGQKALYDKALQARSVLAGAKILTEVFQRSVQSSTSGPEQSGWKHLDEAISVIEGHARIMTQIAYDRKWMDDEVWRKASRACQTYIATMAKRDAYALRDYVLRLAEERRNRLSDPKYQMDRPPPPLVLAHGLLDEAVSLLAVNMHAPSVASLAKSVAKASHLCRLPALAWISKKDGQQRDEILDKNLKPCLKMANAAQDRFFASVSTALRALSDEDSTVIVKALRLDDVAEAVTSLVLSPSENLASAAQAIVRQAFDATSRADCFRELFKHAPESTLKGVIQALRTFKDTAVRFPEACGQAKRLVRCLTDVISVLCDPTEPLMRDEAWVQQHNASSLVSKLWNLMCADVAIIFERTEHWAFAFEADQMTDWMRDALIFLEEMLTEIRAFEAAATGSVLDTNQPTPRKMSTRGKEMILSLNEPLAKLVVWLRLNDKDLLDRTTKTMTRLLDRFARARLPINTEAVFRLRRIAEKFKDGTSRKDMQLQPDQVLSLVAALAKHPDHQEEFANLVVMGTTVNERTRAPHQVQVVDSDSDSDTIEVLSAPGQKSTGTAKGGALPGTTKAGKSQSVKTGSLVPTKHTLPSIPVRHADRAHPSSGVTGPVFKVSKVQPPARPSSRYKTAPSGMKNVIYSHAAMRAARDRSSSEEDENSDSDRPAGLARLAEQHAKLTEAHIAKRQEQRKTKMLELQGPGTTATKRGTRILTPAEVQRQSQDKARMRYDPDYTDLHRQILQWNANHRGSTPHENFRYPRFIPAEFSSPHEYIDTFLPLLLLECWNEITSAQEEIEAGTAEAEPYHGKQSGRISVDDFVEVYLRVDRLPERSPTTENDIVLLRGPCQTLGKVHQIIRKPQNIDIAIRVHLGKDDGTVSRSLANGTSWTIHKLFPLSTAHREYSGLMSLPYYDLMEDILIPQHRPKPLLEDVLLERAMKAYRVNKPQAGAILSALTSTGFSLIQGPPGTGKTKTILGLVGAFLSHRGRRGVPITAGQGNIQPRQGEKLLLCAPSNAAVDEVAKRLKEGVYDADGKKFSPKVVRIGAEFSINISVMDIYLDNLVDKAALGERGVSSASEAKAKIEAARNEMSTLKMKRDEKRAEKNNIVGVNTVLLQNLTNEITQLTQQINNLGEKLDREKDSLTQANRAQDVARRKYRAQILAEADVICTTLSGSGHEYLANFDFETVIIDEAAQSVEISSLIPLRYNCQRCIMVGDPNQLPPTVKSREATNAGYNRSLFVRLHNAAPEATHLLSIQYRMHPDISSFPSKAFYESRLEDGPNMSAATKQPWHDKGDIFPPYAFLHVRNSREEAGKHHSLINREEANIAAALYARLGRDCNGIDLSYRVGIITPYKGQVGELRRTFRRRFGDDITEKVDFNTVDGFQGQEKDIIILSCVRGGKGEGSGVGFLSDVRRMNVALTRARSSLFVLGDAKALRTNEHWRKLVDDAQERGHYKEVDSSSFAGSSTSTSTMTSTNSAKSSATAAGSKTAKGRPSDAASKKILAAPEGLMTPSQLANSKVTSGELNGGANSSSVSGVSGIGQKRRLLQSISGSTTPTIKAKISSGTSPASLGSGNHDAKRVKAESPDPDNQLDDLHSNAADFFNRDHQKKRLSPKHIKQEASDQSELEDGEVPMDGIEYTHREALPSAPIQPKTIASTNQVKTANSNTASPEIGTETAATNGDRRDAPEPTKPASGPTLIPPKRPAANAMFIPRKRPGMPTKPAPAR